MNRTMLAKNLYLENDLNFKILFIMTKMESQIKLIFISNEFAKFDKFNGPICKTKSLHGR